MPAYTSARYQYEGTETTETSIVRVGGATDPAGQTQSRKIVTTANAQWLRPYKGEPLAVWNPTAGADVTATVYGLAGDASILNDEIWAEFEFLGSSSSSLGSIATTTKSNVLATGASVASDGSVWDTSTAPFVTWDTATVTAVTLTGSNLVATNTGSITTDQGAHVASAAGKTTGKYYFELTLTTLGTGGNNGVGIGTTTSTYINMGTSSTTGNMVFRSGNVYANGSNTGVTFGLRASGDQWALAVDLDNRQIWFRLNPSGNWNNSGTANPATNTGGFAIPAGTIVPFLTFGGTAGTVGNVTTANFGASAFSGAVPSGFTSGWPVFATWTPFKLTTTLSSPQPGQAGYIHARIRAAKASATYYIDPQIELSPAAGGTSNVATAYNYKSSRYAYEGTETTETSIVRTGGTADPTGTVQSRKIVTSANAQWLRPFKAEPYAVWNATTGANVTATVYGVAGGGALPLSDEVWAEFEYLGSASSTLGSIVTTTKSHVLATGTAVASDSSVWTGTGVGGVGLATSFDGTPVNVTMSNGNLTVTHGNAINNCGVNSATFVNAGKYYFEITATISGNTTNALGVMLPTATFSTIGSGQDCAIVFTSASSTIWANNVNTGKVLGIHANGDVYGIAVDLTARLAWFRRGGGNWNGDAAANPATGAGGVTIAAGVFAPCVRFSGISFSTDNATGNFGATAFANAAPSGFASWDSNLMPFKLTNTLSAPQPGQAGYIHARVRVGKASATYYIDPQVYLS